MRVFNSGATRDDNIGKLDYVRGLSAQVQQRYLEYLSAHRKQKDGSLRDFDNWKKGIDADAYRESLLRHAHDAERASMGLPVPDDASLQDLLCSVLFNASGWLFELLVAESGNREQVGELATQPTLPTELETWLADTDRMLAEAGVPAGLATCAYCQHPTCGLVGMDRVSTCRDFVPEGGKQ
jgi:hypothetical protein